MLGRLLVWLWIFPREQFNFIYNIPVFFRSFIKCPITWCDDFQVGSRSVIFKRSVVKDQDLINYLSIYLSLISGRPILVCSSCHMWLTTLVWQHTHWPVTSLRKAIWPALSLDVPAMSGCSKNFLILIPNTGLSHWRLVRRSSETLLWVDWSNRYSLRVPFVKWQDPSNPGKSFYWSKINDIC